LDNEYRNNNGHLADLTGSEALEVQVASEACLGCQVEDFQEAWEVLVAFGQRPVASAQLAKVVAAVVARVSRPAKVVAAVAKVLVKDLVVVDRRELVPCDRQVLVKEIFLNQKAALAQHRQGRQVKKAPRTSRVNSTSL
jgi:hypothetical protein